uniref:Uncharacterized protein n=1 Tax=Oryza punctata TaxID=4537 RepID=A0A0E0JEB0_ORYPU
MADVRLRLSRDKLETAKSRERASVAKRYTELLMADLSCMSDMQRMEHERALQYFAEKLYGGSNNDY